MAAHTPSLTLLGGDAGVLLALGPPVRHGLEAAGTRDMASLQAAHVVLGCRTDNTQPGSRDTGPKSRSAHVWGQLDRAHEGRQTHRSTQGEFRPVSQTAS